MRVLLKLSGESLQCEGAAVPFDNDALTKIATEIKKVSDAGHQVVIVVGAGNLLRGADLANSQFFNASVADQMGMIATHMNGLALSAALRAIGVATSVLSSIPVHSIIETYTIEKAGMVLNQSNILILTGGTGHPFCTTDSAAALRAAELRADVLLKATTVDGIYDADPANNQHARRYQSLSYSVAIENNLKIMDQWAFSICQAHAIPIRVFSLYDQCSLTHAVQQEIYGTYVSQEGKVLYYDE